MEYKNMTETNKNFVVQTFGMLGVIGSLIFVGLELQQAQRVAIAGQQQARSALVVDIISNLTVTGIDFQSVYLEEKLDYEFSRNEVGLRNVIHTVWGLYENDFYQHEQGLMDESTWLARKRGIEKLYTMCQGWKAYQYRRFAFSKKFRDVVESFQSTCKG